MDNSTEVEATPAPPDSTTVVLSSSPTRAKAEVAALLRALKHSPARHGTSGNLCFQFGAAHKADEANLEANLHQVLDLVLDYTQDIKTLVKCTAVSLFFMHYVQHTAQRKARSLLEAWKQSVSQKLSCSKSPAKQRTPNMASTAAPTSTGFKEQKYKCLLWLCRTTGVQFVNNPDVACSLLHTLKDTSALVPERLVDVLKEAGLEVTGALLVYACQAQLPVSLIMRQLKYRPGLLVYRSIALLQTPPANPAAAAAAEAAERAQLGHKIERLLKHVTKENLVDLLQITISYQPMARAKIASEVLLKYDQQHINLLHPKKAATLPRQPIGAAVGVLDASKDPMRMQALTMRVKLTRLLQGCAAAGNSDVMKYLAKLPSAEEIRTPVLVEMLQTLIKSPASSSAAASTKTEGMSVLVSLPWALDTSADAITPLITEAISSKVHSVLPLLQLPGARQLGAGVALDLLTKAVNAGLPEVTRELGRLAAGLEPDKAAIQDVLNSISSKYWCQGTVPLSRNRPGPSFDASPFGKAFNVCMKDQQIAPLWNRLTGEDLLLVLEFCNSSGCIYGWNTLMELGPIAQITDSARFVAVYKAALKFADTGLALPDNIPSMQQLQPSEVYDLLKYALQSPVHAVHDSLLTFAIGGMSLHPHRTGKEPQLGPCFAGCAWSAEQVHDMQRLALGLHDWHTVNALCQCPAAEQMSTDMVTGLLHDLLSHPQCSIHSAGRSRSLQQATAAPAPAVNCQQKCTCSSLDLGSNQFSAMRKLLLLRGAQAMGPKAMSVLVQSQSAQPLVWSTVLEECARWLPGAHKWGKGYVHEAVKRIAQDISRPPGSTGRRSTSGCVGALGALLRLDPAQALSVTDVQLLLLQCSEGCQDAVDMIRRGLPEHAGQAALLKEKRSSGSSERSKQQRGVLGTVKACASACVWGLTAPVRFIGRAGKK